MPALMLARTPKYQPNSPSGVAWHGGVAAIWPKRVNANRSRSPRAEGSLCGSMIRFGTKSLLVFGRPAILGPSPAHRDGWRNESDKAAQFRGGTARAKWQPISHFIRRSALLSVDAASRKVSQ